MVRTICRIGRTMAGALIALLIACAFGACTSRAQDPPQKDEPQADASTRYPRGKKLMLKDGGFQIVREYEVKGDRVRYFSLERGEWEEIPAAMVDWEKTKKAEEEDKKHDEAQVAKVKAQEKAAQTVTPLDIDASYLVVPGVFLPDGEGFFAFDGRSVTPLFQADMESKLDKGRAIGKIMLPVPVIPTTHDISLKGTRASFRSTNRQLEFYLRLKDVSEPNLELIRTVIRGKNRRVERINDWFGGQQRTTKDAVATQLWPVAKGLWRVTLGEALPPGEYVMAWMLPGDKPNIVFWDFGIDPKDGEAPAPAPKKKKK